jgi:hypothetical protein
MLPAFLCAMLRAWEPIAEVGSWYLIHSIPAVLQTAHTLKPVSQAKARAMLPRPSGPMIPARRYGTLCTGWPLLPLL